MTEKVRKSTGRRELEELIDTCDSIENRRFNPFLLDINEALNIVRKNAKNWKTIKDNLLDLRAVTGLAKVVGLQSANLRFQSSTLFMDPSLLKQKVESLTRQQLAECFMNSWHPIVELEQITEASTKEAYDYWNSMLSFFERRKRLTTGPFENLGTTNLEELARLRIMEEKAFSKKLEEFWLSLKEKEMTGTGIEYWSYVKGASFVETVTRAQMVSFLLSYGMATLRKQGEKMYLISKEPPFVSGEGSGISLPIHIPKEVTA
jgi:hypothetical protein